MGGNFLEKLEETSKIIFLGVVGSRMTYMYVIFELEETHGVNFGFNEKRWMSLS